MTRNNLKDEIKNKLEVRTKIAEITDIPIVENSAKLAADNIRDFADIIGIVDLVSGGLAIDFKLGELPYQRVEGSSIIINEKGNLSEGLLRCPFVGLSGDRDISLNKINRVIHSSGHGDKLSPYEHHEYNEKEDRTEVLYHIRFKDYTDPISAVEASVVVEDVWMEFKEEFEDQFVKRENAQWTGV